MAETNWLTEGTAEEIVLTALQKIAFEDVDDPRELAQEALHAAGFASLKTTYTGDFRLSWLRPGESVTGAGDGSGDAIVTGVDGIERRVTIGDEVWL